MRFFLDETHTIITCVPEIGSEMTGIVNNRKYRIQNQNLWFNCRPAGKDLHPDLLALICLLVFYPFLQDSQRIIFPKKVSHFFRTLLNLHGWNSNVEVNIDKNLTSLRSFVEKWDERVGLSWGGGLDSWACLKLQPELYHVLIHSEIPEAPLPIHQPDYPSVRIIRTNQREIAVDIESGQNAGWLTWASVLVPILWVCQEYKLRRLALGGNLGSVFLKGGKEYFPTHLKPNLWFQTFDMIGFPLYLPLAGLTDLGVIRVLGSDLDLVHYCPFSDQGNNCHSCWKCVRKEILLGRELSTLGKGAKKWIDRFIGPSFRYVLGNQKGYLDQWIDRYYQPGFQLIQDTRLEQELRKRLDLCEVSILDREKEYLVEHYGWEL